MLQSLCRFLGVPKCINTQQCTQFKYSNAHTWIYYFHMVENSPYRAQSTEHIPGSQRKGMWSSSSLTKDKPWSWWAQLSSTGRLGTLPPGTLTCHNRQGYRRVRAAKTSRAAHICVSGSLAMFVFVFFQQLWGRDRQKSCSRPANVRVRVWIAAALFTKIRFSRALSKSSQ